MSTELLEQAIAATRGVLSNVTKDDLNESTPCASWKVSDLVNHIIGGQRFFARSVSGDSAAPEHVDYSSGDLLAEFDAGAHECVAAFGAEGAMQRMLTLPWGPMPAAGFIALATTDTLCHGWDLARATGQPSDIAPDLAMALLESVRPMLPDAFRGPDGKAPFGPAQSVPEGATPTDQLAAFLGREV